MCKKLKPKKKEEEEREKTGLNTKEKDKTRTNEAVICCEIKKPEWSAVFAFAPSTGSAFNL